MDVPTEARSGFQTTDGGYVIAGMVKVNNESNPEPRLFILKLGSK